MPTTEFDPYKLEGFIPHDPEAIAAKLGDFAMAGPSRLHVVSDWDRTITANGGGRDITSWGVVQRLLPETLLAIDQSLYEQFHPRELDGTLTEAEAQYWWRASLDLHVQNQTNIHDLQEAVRSVGMHPRVGAVELFKLCDELAIPTVILSAGVRNVIDWVTTNYDMHPTVTLATNFLTNVDGRITGWRDDTVVHCFNKQEIGHGEISSIKHDHPNAVLLGDDRRDPGMIDGHDNVVRLQVKDRQPSLQERLDSQDAGYDAIVVGSLLPVEGLIRWVAASRQAA